MASCAFCNSLILFGGSREGGFRYCNETCRQNGILVHQASQLPTHFVQSHTRTVHQGRCPKCSGAGPVDVHTAHRVWSALVLTSCSSHTAISCRGCALKRQGRSLIYSLVLGWWGLPWGLIWTPVQVIRNIVGMVKPPDPDSPSATLQRLVAIDLAAQGIQQAQAAQAAGVPPPIPPTLPPGAS